MRILLALGLLFITAASAGAQTATPERAFLSQYCVTCHNERLKTADLMLDKMDLMRVDADTEAWEKVVRKLRTGLMPPSNARRPERVAIDAFTSKVEDALDRAAALKPNPGAPALHRLNRNEYANAIRDLLDLPVDPTTLLPADDSSEGFDNIADVLGVSPALMQAYVSAAAKISRLAVGDPSTSPARTTYRNRGLFQGDHIEGLPLGTRGGMIVRHVFPLDGEYDFRIARTGAGIGQTFVGGDEELEISVNGERVRLVGTGGPRDIRLVLKAGPQTIGVAIVKKRNVRGVDDLYQVLSGVSGVQNVVITGPLNAAGPGDTPSRRRIFVCRPVGPTPGVGGPAGPQANSAGSRPVGPTLEDQELSCAKQILRTLATRAFRQPVSDADVAMETLLKFYRDGRTQGDFETGIQRGLARVLVDPRFIYRFEREPANLAQGAAYRLSDFEVASRLSFFLWSSIPDDELLQLAAKGKLADPVVLEQQVRRMLADTRAQSLVNNFGGQWLLLRDLRTARPATADFDENLRQSFQRETELLFESIVREDRSVLDLLNADYTFVDERLARHYGIPNIRGSRFRRVTLQEGARRGILGHGSILLATSAGNRTSPVKRGKWVLENLMGAPPPPPPPGVETNLDEGTSAAKVTSMRQRLEQHRSSPGCASCHSIMDPIGFALENYDLIGKWRDSDGGAPVDASSQLVDGTKLNGPDSLRQALLSRSDAFVTTATEKLLTYALGRTVQYYDRPAVRAVVRDAARNQYRFSALIVGIAKSMPFQMKRK